VIVDEDCGIPTSVIDSYREEYDSGPLGPTDPRTLLLSMSDYKQPQSFDVYGKSYFLWHAFWLVPCRLEVKTRGFLRTLCGRGVDVDM
jgi:hypothetical protein